MKNFTRKIFVVAVTTMVAFTANAQYNIVEDFSSFAAGDSIEVAAPEDSEGEPGAEWYRNRKGSLQEGVSLKVVEGALSYAGYIASEQGNSVVYDTANTTGDRSSTRHFIDDTASDIKASDDLFYVACLVNVSDMSTGFKEIFAMETNSGGGNYSRGRVFGKLNGDSLQFAVSLNGTPDDDATFPTVFSTGETQLLVFEYSYDVDGAADPIDGKFYTDSVRLYVNPDLSMTAAENTSIVNSDVKDGYHGGRTWLGMNLRQTNASMLQLSSIVWADEWSQLYAAPATSVNEVASATVNMYVSAGELVIDNNTNGTLEVFGINGAKVFSQAISNNNASVQLGLNNGGLYIARFVDANGVASVQKFTVK